MQKEKIDFEAKLDNPAKINDLITRYKCYICSPDELANGYVFPQSTLDKMKNSILGTAVVASFMEEDGKRFGGHEDGWTKNQDGLTVRSPMPIGVGFADPYVEPWMEEYKGRQFLTCYVYLWTGRYQGLNTIPERTIYQSMEVCTDDEQKDGYKLVNDALVLGLCLLEGGDGGVQPAFDDATIVSFSRNDVQINIDKMKKEFAEMMNNIPDKYKSLNFQIPQEVKNNVKKGLELHNEYKRGGTSVGLSIANYLIDNSIISFNRLKNITNYFSKHLNCDVEKEKINISNEYISWLLFGSNEGFKWSQNLVDSMNKIDKEEKEGKIKKMSFDKDEIGSGDYSIKINKSKEVMSNTSWGNVDKTSQLHKVIKAKNVETVVDDIFALVEADWKNAPSEHLKYPIMEVKSDNEAVYNREALKSALGYAKAQNETSVVSKVIKIYKDLGLTKDNAKDFDFSDEEYEVMFSDDKSNMSKIQNNFELTNNQIREILRNALSIYTFNSGSYTERKYWIFDYDDTYVYVKDEENGYKKYRMTYTIEDKTGCVDTDSAEEIIDNGYTTVKEEKNNMSKSFTKKKEILEKMSKCLEECKYTKDDKEMCKYSVVSYDNENIYAIDKENCKMSAIPYSVDGEDIKPDCSNCKCAKLICGVYSDDGEDDEDSDVMMALNQKFTTDENIEGLANIARSKDETEADKKKITEMAEKIKKMEEDYNKLKCSYDEMAKAKTVLEKKGKDLQVKMSKLEEDKSKLEKDKKQTIINNAIGEIKGLVPDGDIEKLQGEVNTYSKVEEWVEHVQAFAFRYAKENPTRLPLNSDSTKSDPTDIWGKDIPQDNTWNIEK